MPTWENLAWYTQRFLGKIFSPPFIGLMLLIASGLLSAALYGWYWTLIWFWHRQFHHVLWTIGYSYMTLYVIGLGATNLDDV